MALPEAFTWFLDAYQAAIAGFSNLLVDTAKQQQHVLHLQDQTVFYDNISGQLIDFRGFIRSTDNLVEFLRNEDPSVVYKGIISHINDAVNNAVDSWRFDPQWFVDQINAHGWQDIAEELDVVETFAAWSDDYIGGLKNQIYVPDDTHVTPYQAISSLITLRGILTALFKTKRGLLGGIDVQLSSTDVHGIYALANATGQLGTGLMDTFIINDQNKLNHAALVVATEPKQEIWNQYYDQAVENRNIQNKTLLQWVGVIQDLQDGGIDWLTEDEWLQYKDFIDHLTDTIDSLPQGGLLQFHDDFKELEEKAIVITAETQADLFNSLYNSRAMLHRTQLPIDPYASDLWIAGDIGTLDLMVRTLYKTMSMIRDLSSLLPSTHTLAAEGGIDDQLSYDDFLSYMTQLFERVESK